MAEIPTSLLVHTVTVETVNTGGAYGNTYTDPQPVRVRAKWGQDVVRDNTGSEVVVRASLRAGLADRDLFTLGSRVTLDGQVLHVVAAYPNTDGGMGVWEHMRVGLS